MWRFRSIKWLFILQAAVLLFLVIASPLGIVQFHYPRGVENDPLLAPVKVRSVVGDTLVLEDGRTFEVSSFGFKSLKEMVEGSDFRVDLEYSSEMQDAWVFAKSRGWICGTPWQGLITIPLIADLVPINRREPIGLA